MRLAAGSATVVAPGIGHAPGDTPGAGRTQLAALVFVAGGLGLGIASADETKLAVTLTAPASGAVYLAPATIPLSMAVSVLRGKEADREKDKDKEKDKEKGKGKALGKNQGKNDEHGNPHQRVVKVDFLQGATVIGTATAVPYAFEWTNVPAGIYVLTARATNAKGETVSSGPVTVTVAVPVNVAPTVSLTSPADSASFTAPVDIPLSANAVDTDGAITKVEFYNGSTLITTLTVAPYSVIWTGVPQGSYTLTAKATDNQGAESASSPVKVSVNAAMASTLYYIHTDHLNTPRLITNQAQQAVWRWDNIDPFGGNVPDENPSGLGNFTCNLRLPGQYFDQETNTHYNYFRDYDPAIGRYIQSDPIGLLGGANTYAYVLNSPIQYADLSGRYPPGAHNSLSYVQAMGTCVQFQAVELGQKTGDADTGTQDREDAYKHNMCSPGMSAAACQAKIASYIDEQLSLCTLDGLANALHDIQDGYSPTHRGAQVWHGLPGTPGGESYLTMAWHTSRELVPGSPSPARATKATIQDWCQRCRRCR